MPPVVMLVLCLTVSPVLGISSEVMLICPVEVMEIQSSKRNTAVARIMLMKSSNRFIVVYLLGLSVNILSCEITKNIS